MERYFNLYPGNTSKAIQHYQCNLQLAESCYICLSVFEVTLRNALSSQLENMTGREDWYAVFPTTAGLASLNQHITLARKQIINRHEIPTPPKIIAELNFGFWTSLLNSEYELVLWKTLRKAFPYMPKRDKQRKNLSSPLNRFRQFRNRVFHNESICWDLNSIEEIHKEIIKVLGWMDKDVPKWLEQIDRFNDVCLKIRDSMGWR